MRQKKEAMLSQHMNGKTEKEILQTKERMVKTLNKKGYDVINISFTDQWYSDENRKQRGVIQIPVYFLAKSLENMSQCHVAYFCKGWEKTKKHDVVYGSDIIYE